MKRTDLENLVEAAFDYDKLIETLKEAVDSYIDYEAVAELVLDGMEDHINHIAAQAAMDYLELPEPELPF